MAHGLRDPVLRLGVEEHILTALEQRLMGVHARAVLPEDRLRHEGGM
jgi:hypothetical protein